MRRGDEVDVVRPLLLELEHDLDQASGRDFDAKSACRDLMVLAVHTFEGAGGKEDRARPALAGDGRLLPIMQCRTGDFESVVRPAHAMRPRRAIRPAATRAKLAMTERGGFEQVCHGVRPSHV